ncbi:glutathione S-transferase 1 isoform X1 [Nematostella vectensis]|uniref:glutathione S-transferase 1 isoform X1 n=1 Tax=Nematostella vectensis TaxID=45351 RepID=UPI0020771576|nr:glutathione S-transferase 1 isoform X1 [Nematostella vectensis]
MPSYKLHYFNARGRAEPARLAFAAAGIEYEDKRFEGREEWLRVKPELDPPFGQVPLLVIDDKIKLAQSMAILAYVAREGGLAPTNSLDIAMCDMIVGVEGDLNSKGMKWFMEKDEKKKKELREELDTTHIPAFLEAMSKFLEKNGTGFLVTDKLTYADILVFNVCDNAPAEVLKKCPKMKGFHELIAAIPGIKAWLEKRPKTSM